MSDTPARKRKSQSTPEMGNYISKRFKRPDEAAAAAAKDQQQAGGAADPDVKSDATEDIPPALERQDEQPAEENKTPDPSPITSPIKKDEGDVKEATEDDQPAEEIKTPDLSPITSPIKKEEDVVQKEEVEDDLPRDKKPSPIASPVKKEGDVVEKEEVDDSSELPLDKTPDVSPIASPSPISSPEAKKEEEEEEEVKVVEKPKVSQPQRSSSRGKKTIADYGYHFKDGKLRSIEDDGPFKFTTQKEYEALGDLIGDAVYELMEEAGLEKKYLEVGRNRRFYFTSPDYADKETILVLIHGSGVVKAGQWARKLIMNESLERGTQLDYIKRGLANNWGIVVLNYNEACVGQAERCHSPNAHANEEWKQAFPSDVDAQILVVAHSFGGSIISDQVKRMMRLDDYRVGVVALTDSWFSEGDSVLAANWNTTKKRLHCTGNAVWQMYSGDPTHEGTSATAINSIFHVLEAFDKDLNDEDFEEILDQAEDIVVEEHREKMRKKRLANGDTASAKSLELEGEQKKAEKKEKEKEKEEEKGEEKEAEVKKEKEEKEDEKAKGDDQEKEEEQEQANVEPEREPSDNDDSDEGVEKDADTPSSSDNDENRQ